jgi:serine protease Do
MEEYNLPEGLYVSAIIEKSDAAKKGLRTGDIITRANGQATPSLSELAALTAGLGIGDPIELTVFREGKTFKISVELMDRAELFG